MLCAGKGTIGNCDSGRPVSEKATYRAPSDLRWGGSLVDYFRITDDTEVDSAPRSVSVFRLTE